MSVLEHILHMIIKPNTLKLSMFAFRYYHNIDDMIDVTLMLGIDFFSSDAHV